MDYITLVTAIITMLGFVIQMRDIFPKYRKQRQNLLILSFGIFIGLLIGLTGKTVSLPQEIHLFPMLMIVVTLSIFGYLFWIAVRFIDFSNEQHSNHLEKILRCGLGIFLFSLVVLAFSFGGTSKKHLIPYTSNPSAELTQTELVELAKASENKGQLERALYFLNRIDRPRVIKIRRRGVFTESDKSREERQEKSRQKLAEHPVEKEISRIRALMSSEIMNVKEKLEKSSDL